MKKSILSLVISFCIFNLFGQDDGAKFWEVVEEATIQSQTNERWIIPQVYNTLQLDKSAFETILRQAPLRNNAAGATLTIAVSMPNGETQQFAVVESSIMAPELAAKFPNIKTYSGKGIDDPQASIYLDVTKKGLHGMILSANGTVFIDPYYRDSDEFYVVYYKRDFVSDKNVEWSCDVIKEGDELERDEQTVKDPPVALGRSRMETIETRTYRIAIAANGEFTIFHGGTVADGMAGITTTLNRVRGVYEDELAVSFTLVPNNDLIVFTNPNTDPYSNNSNAINQNEAVLDDAIGDANYDVGHVFTTGSGGVAGLGVICNNNRKADGTTGLPNPTGDPFDIDFVSHELGHQFAGNHTFNGDSGSCSGGNRNGSTAYEPGSGSTIQAYAGICSNDNLQSNSDPYFHLISLDEMRNHVTAGSGGSCGTLDTANPNTTPTANANAENVNGKTIPESTPFELTGSATDPDGDNLIYNWEQWDLGQQADVNFQDANVPIFRSFNPDANPTRTFPLLDDILNGTSTTGVNLPTLGRSMTFQFIARDDNLTVGAYDSDEITINVADGTGPFMITSPNAAGTFSGTTTVTWDVAGTTASPISCADVDIYLSTDGGQTFSTLLLDNTTNDGTADVVLPNINTTMARLKVKCADNVFFDINDANFTVEPGGPVCAITNIAAGNQTACVPNTNTYTQAVIVTYENDPGNGNLVVNGQNFGITGSPQTVILTNLTADGNMVNVTANFSDEMGCSSTENNLFQAPISCEPVCAITNLASGAQTACNSSDNTYNQAVIVTYENDPGNGNLVVNGQNFGITGSPQTVILTNLTADGNMVNVTANFSDDTGCMLTSNGLFTAPDACKFCEDFASTDTPIAIPSVGTPTVLSTINVMLDGTVTDVNVKNINGPHSFENDLVFTLISPMGTRVELIDIDCPFSLGDRSGFDYSFDDASATPISCGLVNGTTYQPSGNLADFNTESSMGDWQLEVKDEADRNGGDLDGWTLELCVELMMDPDPDPCAVMDLMVTDITTSDTTYLSGGTITSTGTVVSGSTVNFKAPTSITLSPDFIAESGSVFTATLEACVTPALQETVIARQAPQLIDNEFPLQYLTALKVFPNPFNNTTQIAYQLENEAELVIRLFDLNGKEVRQVLAPTTQQEGIYQVELTAGNLPTGMYLLHFQTVEAVLTKRLIIQR